MSPYTIQLGGPRNVSRVTIELACRIAVRFRRGIPHWTELRDQYGMSRATAYRWIASMKAAGYPQVAHSVIPCKPAAAA